MCGNFGLLLLGLQASAAVDANSQNDSFHKKNSSPDILDKSINESMHEVSKLQGIRYRGSAEGDEFEQQEIIPPLKILEAQTACTEIRGGQAGGFSSIEYKYEKSRNQSHFDTLFEPPTVAIPTATRVRMVARKRHPLAADLSQLYLRQRHGKQLDPKQTVTVIGHTRFATSSVNIVSELHPHEWVPFHEEVVWQFSSTTGKFDRVLSTVGLHLSHNGDFDAMEAYAETMVVGDVGLWLERVLHTPNSTRGDSPKVAGTLDLLRVQGRWAAAVRLAWIRCVFTCPTDATNGEQLSKTASNAVPTWSFWLLWETIFEKHWQYHLNNVIKVVAPNRFDLKKRHSYSLSPESVKQFEQSVVEDIQQECLNVPQRAKQLGISTWSGHKLQALVHTTIRGFLHGDLYNAMTEILSRAEGTFGLQAHCTLEPGVVVIASKGQPMSIAFDPANPLVLFASEAEALAVPVYQSGKWLPQRIDLDSHGEIFRIGEPRALQEGHYRGNRKAGKETSTAPTNTSSALTNRNNGTGKPRPSSQELWAVELQKRQQKSYVLLDCGIEIRSYSLVKLAENTMLSLVERSVRITSAPIPYDPSVDLVANDLKVTPAVIAAIDHAWSNLNSVERISGKSLAENLVRSMQRRQLENKDTTDLIIGGVEVSLWLGEQFAADLRRIFPNLNVVTVSANKLIGLGDENPSKVFFPSSEEIPIRRIDENTCVLLISQSGQTFATLHATRKMVTLAKGKVWILTGCFHSKMQQVLMDDAASTPGRDFRNRVFNNYSGHRPAEPSSVAVAATWHTLSRIILQIVEISREMCPGGRFIHTWDLDSYAYIVQTFMVKAVYRLRHPRGTTSVARSSHNASHLSSSSAADKGIDISSIYPDQKSNIRSLVAVPPLPPSSSKPSNASANSNTRPMKLLSNNPQVLMNLSDGCISDFRSLLTNNLTMNLSQIVGYDQFGRSLIDDLHYQDSPALSTTHIELVEQGKQWAAHVNESWHVLVFVGLYIMLSVGLSITIFGVIGDAVLAIVRAGLGDSSDDIIGRGHFSFPPRSPSVIYQQPLGYTLIGLFLQFLDGCFFVYLGKNMTRFLRLIHGRPLAARHGKRTIVIVDSPCVHQLVEIFVSKLFSQSYSIVSVDVHGASGLDHFVHRFTHRVVRGVLLAVGRPDGRLCCLSKSEASVLLSTKQAAFICNPDYHYPGSGPEIVTIGHNPYQPNVGLTSNHICLHGGLHTSSISDKIQMTTAHGKQIAIAARRNSSVDQLSMLSSHGAIASNAPVAAVGVGGINHTTHAREISQRAMNRKKFVDEYLYDRLFVAKKPFTVSILRTLRRSYDEGSSLVRSRVDVKGSIHNSTHNTNAVTQSPNLNHSMHMATSSYHMKRARKSIRIQQSAIDLPDEPLPYGAHHIDPAILEAAKAGEPSVLADFIMTYKELLKPQILDNTAMLDGLKEKSFDPAVRLAFSSKLDTQARQVQDLQVIIQQLYECRVASLERYLAFCVMFHTMAKRCSSPWLMYPWDIARSQSNLRVATTASPISAVGSDGSANHTLSTEAKKIVRQFISSVRKFEVYF